MRESSGEEDSMRGSTGEESSGSEHTDYSEASDDDASHPSTDSFGEVGAVGLNRFFDEIVEPVDMDSVPEGVAGTVDLAGMLEADVSC